MCRLVTIGCIAGFAWAALACAQAQEIRLAPGKENAARLRWLQYRMVAGRVVTSSNYPEGMNISFGPSAAGGQREHLRLLILKQHASVHYDLAGGGQQLTVELAESGEFSIHRTSTDPPYAMQFTQQPGGAIDFHVESGQQQLTLVADSFWHLYLANPAAVARHVIPHLEILRPSWQLVATGEAIERTLVQRAQHPQPLETDRWQRLVEQLASSKFSERETAERELLRVGQAILPFLEGLRRERLDAEQDTRIRKLVDELSVNYEDTIDRVANWLAADQTVWLSLLARDEPLTRTVALRQLQSLTGASIAFDSEADAATRQAQLDVLQARYAATRPSSAAPAQGSVPPPRLER
jgi:hypothetical protein